MQVLIKSSLLDSLFHVIKTSKLIIPIDSIYIRRDIYGDYSQISPVSSFTNSF